MDYPRRELMDHVAKKSNICMLLPRQIGVIGWRHCVVSDIVAESCVVSTKTKEGNYVFPLYLYPTDASRYTLFADHKNPDVPGGRKPNLSPKFIEDFAARIKMAFVSEDKGDREKTFGPEDVFSYMYAVFHAPTYRRRYAEFLKIDFPRLPLTSDPGLFRSLCELGRGLVALHLLEEYPAPATRFPIAGDGTVETVRYAEPGQGGDAGRVWINKTQYFEGVTPEIWAFHVGGYQVCQKWLKDRKGRRLSYDDITHYQRIVAALGETIRLMAEIDRVIEAHGGWPLK
jgi:hypothetical protein